MKLVNNFLDMVLSRTKKNPYSKFRYMDDDEIFYRYSAKVLETLKEQLLEHEGKRNKPYKDSLGYSTVGVGHMIKDDDPDWVKKDKLSDLQIEKLFQQDIVDAVHTYESALSEEVREKLGDSRKIVLMNMAFNLGSRIHNFKNMLRAVRDEDYEWAADEMRNSKWYEQVKSRGEELADIMEKGHF